MPELPEVEITVRRIGAAIAGSRVESALAPGINALKTHAPPLSALADRAVLGARRRGKLLIVDFATTDALQLFALVSAILALGVVYWLVRDRDLRERSASVKMDLPTKP